MAQAAPVIQLSIKPAHLWMGLISIMAFMGLWSILLTNSVVSAQSNGVAQPPAQVNVVGCTDHSAAHAQNDGAQGGQSNAVGGSEDGGREVVTVVRHFQTNQSNVTHVEDSYNNNVGDDNTIDSKNVDVKLEDSDDNFVSVDNNNDNTVASNNNIASNNGNTNSNVDGDENSVEDNDEDNDTNEDNDTTITEDNDEIDGDQDNDGIDIL